ncbi:MAG: UDP-N-acetylmuramoyl-L-alanyl-D-glutamate--2,6-diaminopimelate ligase [Candidatus Omnitrophota bacterium]
MKLEKLLKGIYKQSLPASFIDFDARSVSSDSRAIEKGSLFVAVKGPILDGTQYIDDAVKKGAKIVVADSYPGGVKKALDAGICFLAVADPKKFLTDIAKNFYGDPSRKIKVIGITGTNGKTTTSYLVESILAKAAEKCSVIGTINHRIGNKILPSKNTTPGVIDNQHYLSDMVKEGVGYCAMEVSSHALDQGRVDGIDFNSAIFTNLTGDHMDYHQNMENYFQAKAKLFSGLSKDASAIINADDPYGKRLVSLTKAKVITYGITHQADIVASDIQLSLSGSKFTLRHGKELEKMTTKLIGRHNIYNILSAVAQGLWQKIDMKDVERAIEDFENVPGRLERIEAGQDFHVFVDYAHTEDALKNILTNLRLVTKSRIILVFGCGGDRDKTKRPKMGMVASQLADFCIVTSDNSRSEDPQVIANEIIQGCKNKNFTVILDREEAIKKAITLAGKNDVVVVAGKGHETYQIFKEKTISFDDCDVVKKYLHAKS